MRDFCLQLGSNEAISVLNEDPNLRTFGRFSLSACTRRWRCVLSYLVECDGDAVEVHHSGPFYHIHQYWSAMSMYWNLYVATLVVVLRSVYHDVACCTFDAILWEFEPVALSLLFDTILRFSSTVSVLSCSGVKYALVARLVATLLVLAKLFVWPMVGYCAARDWIVCVS